MLRLPPCERGTCFVRVLAGSPAYKCFCQRRKPWRKAGFIPAAQVKLIGVPGQSAGLAGGNPKGGGRPLLCRRGGGVHRGGTPSKGSRPYACFWLLFARAKSNSGCGAESPIRFRKETCFSPPARRHANLSPSVPCAGTARSE